MSARLKSLASWLLLACCSLVHASTSSHLIEGRVDIPGKPCSCEVPSKFPGILKHPRSQLCLYAVQVQHLVPHNDISVLLALNGGEELRAFAKPDGSFVFHNVPAGTHMLDVVAMHLVYPQVSADLLQSLWSKQVASHAVAAVCKHRKVESNRAPVLCTAYRPALLHHGLSMCRCSFAAWNLQCVCAGQAGRESHRRGDSGVCGGQHAGMAALLHALTSGQALWLQGRSLSPPVCSWWSHSLLC